MDNNGTGVKSTAGEGASQPYSKGVQYESHDRITKGSKEVDKRGEGNVGETRRRT